MMEERESYTNIEFGCIICGKLDCDCKPDPDPLDRYRIKRRDPNNIVIEERLGDKRWRAISHHGNSASSLLSGIFNLIVAEHTPEGSNLPEQLEKLRLELVSSVSQVEKMIKEADCVN
jgi:hypothetical protein